MNNYVTTKPTNLGATSNKRRTAIASGIMLTVILGISIIVAVVALGTPKRGSPPGQEVSTAIVFGLPVAQYSGILKNASLTELQYNETMKRWESHKAVALEAPIGTPVLATFAGTVTNVSTHKLYGRQVTIEHRNGLKTVYSNLDANVSVTEGQRVEKGTQIGKVGQTSSIEFVDKPHVRVEVYKDGKRVDPNDYIDFPVK